MERGSPDLFCVQFQVAQGQFETTHQTATSWEDMSAIQLVLESDR